MFLRKAGVDRGVRACGRKRGVGHAAVFAVMLAGFAAVPHPASAQAPGRTLLDFGTGSEHEDYLRAMQIAGIVPLYPWSIRGFSPRELDRLIAADSTGPWQLARSRTQRGFTVGAITGTATFNSAFPYGSNDGVVWAGRGLTAAASGGVVFRRGPLSLAIAPVGFVTSNASFPLLDNGRSGPLAFNDGTFSDIVDRPQRFGDGSYGRLDPGSSTVRFDARFVTVGASTANQWIGPATQYPFLLGTNAPGFPHLFAGTGDPLNIWIGRAHARLVWGELAQSEFSPVTGADRYVSQDESGRIRLATSGSLVFVPRGIPGLEIGTSRFFHMPFPESGIPGRFWAYAFSGLLGTNEITRLKGGEETAENQLASAYFRWAFPGSGLEIFGERGYEDWFYDMRDLIQQSDYYRFYSLGLRKSLALKRGAVDVLAAEVANYQMPPSGRDRPNAWSIYGHSVLRQGHTHRGQLLGSDVGVGVGAASALSWTRYTAHGRTAATWRRTVRAQNGVFYLGGVRDLEASDVIHSIGIERTRFGKVVDMTLAIDLMRNFNRNFSGDATNVSLRSGFQWRGQR